MIMREKQQKLRHSRVYTRNEYLHTYSGKLNLTPDFLIQFMQEFSA